MGKGINLSKVKVGDTLYSNGPVETEVVVIKRYLHDHWLLAVNRDGSISGVANGDAEYSRKPKKHVVYYPCHLDDVLSNLESHLVSHIKRISSTAMLVEGAMNA